MTVSAPFLIRSKQRMEKLKRKQSMTSLSSTDSSGIDFPSHANHLTSFQHQNNYIYLTEVK